jgi:hypothetical protein
LKRVAVNIINWIVFNYYNLKFSFLIYFKYKNDSIVFIDIDNTIADTWPTLVNNSRKDELKRILKIPVLKGMQSFISKNYLNIPKTNIVYLTARHFSQIGVTNKWLLSNNFLDLNTDIIVVFHPSVKLHFIKKAVHKKLNVTYIDDLSYNHENNEIRFYDDIINEVSQLPINYINYSKILNINNVK